MRNIFIKAGIIGVLATFMLVGNIYSVAVVIQPNVVKAIEYQSFKVEGQYVTMGETKVDLTQQSVLIIDGNSTSVADTLRLMPPSKRPLIIFNQGTAQSAEFLTGLDYVICNNTGMPSPTLLMWQDDQLQGYMYSSVDNMLYEKSFPRLIGKGQVYNNTDNPSGNNAYQASEQSQYAVIMPGEEYKFYDYVLPSVEAGYQQGISFFPDGKGGFATGLDLGGGICKTATVLHYAVVDAGLTETERGHHSLPVSYAVPGDDAMVARNSSDYRFVNTHSNPIVIIFIQTEDRLMAGIYEVVNTDTINTDIPEMIGAQPWIFNAEPVSLTVPSTTPKIITPPTLSVTQIDPNAGTNFPETKETTVVSPSDAVKVQPEATTPTTNKETTTEIKTEQTTPQLTR